MANIITISRIIISFVILPFDISSNGFYIIYLFGGLTDVLDGIVARKTNTESSFGSKLDTIADFCFAIAITVKLITNYHFPTWLFVWIIVIILIKIFNVLSGYKKLHRFIAIHSMLNKICGLMVFCVPFILYFDFAWQIKAISVIIICFFATVAAIKEGRILK